MMILDELVVMDNGDVQLCIVPPDEVSTEPEFLVVCPVGTEQWDDVQVHLLRLIAKRLDLHSDVVGLVHGGEDRYTVRTSEGRFVEVNAAEHPAIVRSIEEAAAKAGQAAVRDGRLLR
jgi:hypothetical protein